jgi:hypothetical protein
LVDFLVNIWLENALLRLIAPVPVALKRLAAPRFVFIFGMTQLLYASYTVLLNRSAGPWRMTGQSSNNYDETQKTI